MISNAKSEKADATTVPDPPKVVARARWKFNIIQVLLALPISFTLWWYSPTFLRLLDPKASSFTIDLMEAFIIAVVGVWIFAPMSHLLAKFNEKQFRENSFGTWSRYAVLYIIFYLGLVWLAASMLRPPR